MDTAVANVTRRYRWDLPFLRIPENTPQLASAACTWRSGTPTASS